LAHKGEMPESVAKELSAISIAPSTIKGIAFEQLSFTGWAIKSGK